MIASTVQIPEVRLEPVIASVHIFKPLAFDGKALEESSCGIAAPKERVAGLAEPAGPGAVIVAADFNGAPDTRRFRDLISDGLPRCCRTDRRGLRADLPGYPAFPPFVTIDSVLTQPAAVSSIRTIDLPGSESPWASGHRRPAAGAPLILSNLHDSLVSGPDASWELPENLG